MAAGKDNPSGKPLVDDGADVAGGAAEGRPRCQTDGVVRLGSPTAAPADDGPPLPGRPRLPTWSGAVGRELVIDFKRARQEVTLEDDEALTEVDGLGYSSRRRSSEGDPADESDSEEPDEPKGAASCPAAACGGRSATSSSTLRSPVTAKSAATEVNHRALRRKHTTKTMKGDFGFQVGFEDSVMGGMPAFKTSVYEGACQESLQRKEGRLFKARPGWLNPWQPRWFVLENMQFKWYSNHGDQVPLGVISFDLVACEVERLFPSRARIDASKAMFEHEKSADLVTKPEEERWSGFSGVSGKSKRSCCSPCDPTGWFAPEESAFAFRVCLMGSNRVFELCAEDLQTAEAWVEALTQHMIAAELSGRPKSSAELQLDSFGRRAWWKVDRLSAERFEEIAQTGDLLLFRSRGTMPRIIRTASGGRFDHIALLIRLADQSLGLLEATGMEGVAIVTWREFLRNRWHTLYPELALRRVCFPRTGVRMTKLQEWAKSVIGKPYSLTLAKLRKQKSFSQGGEKQDGKFFCSELVAEALKVLEVVPRGRSSTQFWPSTFSYEQQPPIELMQGCSLGEQLTLDFNLIGEGPHAGCDSPSSPRTPRVLYLGAGGGANGANGAVNGAATAGARASPNGAGAAKERDATTNWFRGF